MQLVEQLDSVTHLEGPDIIRPSRLRSGRRSVYEKEGHRRRPRGTEFPKATGQHAHVVRILFSLTDSHVGSCNVPNQPSLSTLAPVFRRLWRVPAEGLA